MKAIKKFITTDVRNYFEDAFEPWEIWVYFVILPVGFILSALIGYVLGTI